MSKPSSLLDSIIKYTLAAILITVPLFPKFPFIKIPETFVSIRLEDILLFFAGILVLIIILRDVKQFFHDRINNSIAIFLSAGLLSLISAVFISQTVIPHIGLLHWLRRIEYFIPFILAVYSIKRNRTNLEFFIKILLIVIFFVFIYGFGQKNLSWPIIITQNEEYSKGVALRYIPGGHINSTFAGHYDLGSFLVLVLPVLIASIFVVPGFNTKTFFSISAFLSLWLLVNTASRISLISYLVAVSLALLFVKKFKALILVLIISLVFVSLSSSLISRYVRIIDVITGREQQFKQLNFIYKPVYASETNSLPVKNIKPVSATPTPVFEDRSTNIRLNVEWPRAIRALKKNPFLGTGYSSITLATDNEYLRLMGEIGVVGLLAFFLIFARILIIYIRNFPFTKYFSGLELSFVAGIAASIPGIFLNAVFIDLFEASKFAILFWLMTGFTVGLMKKN